jgi:hypothetical protein
MLTENSSTPRKTCPIVICEGSVKVRVMGGSSNYIYTTNYIPASVLHNLFLSTDKISHAIQGIRCAYHQKHDSTFCITAPYQHIQSVIQ